MPKGYILAEVKVTGPAVYETYRACVMATLEPFGGRFVVRGGEPKLLEGAPALNRVVVLEFDSPERAMAWYTSPAYQKIQPLRAKASEGRLHCLTGL